MRSQALKRVKRQGFEREVLPFGQRHGGTRDVVGLSLIHIFVGAQESLKARLESFEKDVRVEVVSERGGAEAENGDGRRQSRGEYVAPDERDA